MKILVTGARGQLGCSLQKISAEYPDHTFVFTDLPEGDITLRSSVEKLIVDNGIEAIINCAAYTAVDKAETERELADRINRTGAWTLATVAAQFDIRLVHISTDYVFDGTATKPYRTNDTTNPLSVYGATKLAGEIAVRESGCKAAVVRTQWLYSEFGNNFVKTMLRIGAQKRTVGVVADQYGTPCYATDLARAIMAIVQHGIEGFELYHFSNSGEASWFDFAKAIFETDGSVVVVNPIKTADYPTPAKRPAYSVLDKSKIMALGIAIPEWHEALRRCMNELKNREQP